MVRYGRTEWEGLSQQLVRAKVCDLTVLHQQQAISDVLIADRVVGIAGVAGKPQQGSTMSGQLALSAVRHQLSIAAVVGVPARSWLSDCLWAWRGWLTAAASAADA